MSYLHTKPNFCRLNDYSRKNLSKVQKRVVKNYLEPVYNEDSLDTNQVGLGCTLALLNLEIHQTF